MRRPKREKPVCQRCGGSVSVVLNEVSQLVTTCNVKSCGYKTARYAGASDVASKINEDLTTKYQNALQKRNE